MAARGGAAAEAGRVSAANDIGAQPLLVAMLALSLVLGAAIEDLTDFDALAARKVHATFGTAHHVFGLAARAARLPGILVGLQYPVEQRKYRKQEEKFRQAACPPAEVALVCRNTPLRSSRLDAVANELRRP